MGWQGAPSHFDGEIIVWTAKGVSGDGRGGTCLMRKASLGEKVGSDTKPRRDWRKRLESAAWHFNDRYGVWVYSEGKEGVGQGYIRACFTLCNEAENRRQCG